MKLGKYILVLVVVLVSCKSQKDVVSNSSIKSLSSRKISNNHKDAMFESKTMEAKLKVNYKKIKSSKKTSYSFSVRLRMLKDSVIWMKGNYKILSAFRLKITPNKVSFYSPLTKEYFEGDFSVLQKMLGADIGFDQLQNLLLGQSLLELKGNKFHSAVFEDKYQLTSKKSMNIGDFMILLNPTNFKIVSQSLVTPKSDRLGVAYDEYTEVEKEWIPKKMKLSAKSIKNSTSIDIEFKSILLNKELETPYSIPLGYKLLKL